MYSNRGILVRLIYLAVSSAWWMLTGFGCLRGRRAVVLCYHGVSSSQRDRFRRQMRCIAARAIGVADLDDAGSRGSRRRLPRVCVTFDDAFANLCVNALPIAQEQGIPVTIFAPSAVLGHTPTWNMPPGHPEAHEPTMSIEALRSVAGLPGVTIGSHTVSHPRLNRVPRERVRAELTESKAALERIAGQPIENLAFPHGAYDQTACDESLRAGYRRMFSLDHCLHPGRLPPAVIGRFSMSPDAWPMELWLTTAGAYAWLRPWRRLADFLRTWSSPDRPASAAPSKEPTSSTCP